MLVLVSQTQKHNSYSIKELAVARHWLSQSLRSHYITHLTLPEVTVLTATSSGKNAFLNPTVYQDSYHQAKIPMGACNSNCFLFLKEVLCWSYKNCGTAKNTHSQCNKTTIKYRLNFTSFQPLH